MLPLQLTVVRVLHIGGLTRYQVSPFSVSGDGHMVTVKEIVNDGHN